MLIPKGINDKYEVISTLQEKAATAVLLVRHRQIGDIRILKAIHKSHPDATQILSEANLLAGIKSPGVPTIFDVSQTDEFFYLVEEYVKGEPLQELFLENEAISLQELLKIIIEVCKVIESLHDMEPEAILYLDMKPEHIYMQEDKIKIIDFGACRAKSQTGQGANYCSKTYAAPEQLAGKPLDERADVFGIGKVLEEAERRLSNNEGYKLKNIVIDATERDRDKRISSVMELRARLEKLQGRVKNEKLEGEHLNKTIAVCASSQASGCTHIAINLCKYLNDRGNKFFYASCDGQDNVQQLSKMLTESNIRKGVLYHKSFRGVVEYGPCVEHDTPPVGNYVNDFGCVKRKPDDDLIIFVLNLCPWKSMDIPEWIRDENVLVISNFGSKISALKYSKLINKRVLMYPSDSRAFGLSKKEKQIFDVIRESKEIEVHS